MSKNLKINETVYSNVNSINMSTSDGDIVEFIDVDDVMEHLPDLSNFGDATAADVVSGKSFTSAAGVAVTGSHTCPVGGNVEAYYGCWKVSKGTKSNLSNIIDDLFSAKDGKPVYFSGGVWINGSPAGVGQNTFVEAIAKDPTTQGSTIKVEQTSGAYLLISRTFTMTFGTSDGVTYIHGTFYKYLE